MEYKELIEALKNMLLEAEKVCAPAHIDRDKWGPLEDCKSCASCENSTRNSSDMPCVCCEDYCYWLPRKFCPECGRPLTEKAWAELERRVCGE